MIYLIQELNAITLITMDVLTILMNEMFDPLAYNILARLCKETAHIARHDGLLLRLIKARLRERQLKLTHSDIPRMYCDALFHIVNNPDDPNPVISGVAMQYNHGQLSIAINKQPAMIVKYEKNKACCLKVIGKGREIVAQLNY